VRRVLCLQADAGADGKMRPAGRPDVEEILRRVVEKIRRDYDPEKIILFGSYARGEPSEDSDIDLFIVKETDKRPIDRFVEVSEITYERGLKAIISPLIYTPEEVQERLDLGDDFVEEVLSKGRLVYAKG